MAQINSGTGRYLHDNLVSGAMNNTISGSLTLHDGDAFKNNFERNRNLRDASIELSDILSDIPVDKRIIIMERLLGLSYDENVLNVILEDETTTNVYKRLLFSKVLKSFL